MLKTAPPKKRAPAPPEPDALEGRAWLTPPAGTRDVLPPEASERRALGRALGDVYRSYGYALTTTPPFERVDVLERLGTLVSSDVLQFIDGDTGEVAIFRPDITPQIARLVATRLRDRPPPYRLAYEGHVIRRRRGRARLQRQIAQSGIECIGLPGAEGDAEIIEVAAAALAEVGLSSFTIELALVPLTRRLLERLPASHRVAATEAMARKDKAALASAAGDGKDAARLAALLDLHGDVSALKEAARTLRGEPALEGEVQGLAALVKVLDARGLGSRLAVDLGEVRGFGYYTGPSFALHARGPGEPLGAGGRYDDLLARFGHPAPGAGLAIDLDHLGWALDAARGPRDGRGEIDCAVLSGGARARATAAALRDAGLAVAEVPGRSVEGALAWARAWSVATVVEADRALRAHDVATKSSEVHASDEALSASLRSAIVKAHVPGARAAGTIPKRANAVRRARSPEKPR